MLAEKIQDVNSNTTRFILIAKNEFLFKKNFKKNKKCSMVFILKHKAGSLVKILKKFSSLNLTKIESRPIKNRPFEYQFFLDLEIKNQKELDKVWRLNHLTKKKLQDLQIKKVKILGCYEKV